MKRTPEDRFVSETPAFLWKDSLNNNLEMNSSLPVYRGLAQAMHAQIQHELTDKRKRKRGWIDLCTPSYTLVVFRLYQMTEGFNGFILPISKQAI